MVPLHLVMWWWVCARVILYATAWKCVYMCVLCGAAWSHENSANEGLLFTAGTSGQTSAAHTQTHFQRLESLAVNSATGQNFLQASWRMFILSSCDGWHNFYGFYTCLRCFYLSFEKGTHISFMLTEQMLLLWLVTWLIKCFCEANACRHTRFTNHVSFMEVCEIGSDANFFICADGLELGIFYNYTQHDFQSTLLQCQFLYYVIICY